MSNGSRKEQRFNWDIEDRIARLTAYRAQVPPVPFEKIAEEFGTTKNAVTGKARRLALQGAGQIDWTDAKDAQLTQLWSKNVLVKEIAKQLEGSVREINRQVQKLALAPRAPVRHRSHQGKRVHKGWVKLGAKTKIDRALSKTAVTKLNDSVVIKPITMSSDEEILKEAGLAIGAEVERLKKIALCPGLARSSDRQLVSLDTPPVVDPQKRCRHKDNALSEECCPDARLPGFAHCAKHAGRSLKYHGDRSYFVAA